MKSRAPLHWLGAYFWWRRPGDFRPRSGERVQWARIPKSELVVVGATLRAAGIEPGSPEEERLITFALQVTGPDGKRIPPPPEYARWLRHTRAAIERGETDLRFSRRVTIRATLRAALPRGASGLRELPLDPRSPILGEYEVEEIG